jgi:hypothetical protein
MTMEVFREQLTSTSRRAAARPKLCQTDIRPGSVTLIVTISFIWDVVDVLWLLQCFTSELAFSATCSTVIDTTHDSGI